MKIKWFHIGKRLVLESKLVYLRDQKWLAIHDMNFNCLFTIPPMSWLMCENIHYASNLQICLNSIVWNEGIIDHFYLFLSVKKIWRKKIPPDCFLNIPISHQQCASAFFIIYKVLSMPCHKQHCKSSENSSIVYLAINRSSVGEFMTAQPHWRVTRLAIDGPK